ncbi:hypothetical protein E3O55_09905 [Cryobacterium sp. MDB1-18-2]|uniref:hypothetical protein n=1 Tax=unclassified Cryobacterium TaxID=2649013 RepID=UPI0010698965|nr:MULTISPECIES: hypothetical protein [unclassified Cryobacterium]TFC29179.1 hypothetical protein E3O55_09905 [Cryobacterium sp. MDB1-18-2]TFC45541.1 hypothetical protein E3O50_03575 [Cryobacterium sp. MDB1-18-1]
MLTSAKSSQFLGVVFVVFMLAACSTSAGPQSRAEKCVATLSGVASINVKSEQSTKDLMAVLVPLIAEPTGDWSQIVDPGKSAASAYRDLAKSFATLGDLAAPPYSAAAVAVSESYNAVASGMDELVDAAGQYSADRSESNQAALGTAWTTESTALAANKKQRTAAGQLPSDTSSICN